MKKLIYQNMRSKIIPRMSHTQTAILFTILIILIFASGFLNALIARDKTGSIAGKLVDGETGDPLISANVVLDGTTRGASSDLDGTFVITDVPVGSYTVIIMYVGYAETRITDVSVKVDKTTKLEVAVKPEAISTEEVVVEARLLENTEASLLKKRQRSNAVSDAVSAEEFSRTGSGDAAEAVKQVVGASVVDGKYVYVRGLGERYSSTQLNGAELPSSDPEKKAFQLDLLPTNLLDNIVAVKTFTPDRPGNFSGGIVDVATKTFPENFTLKASYASAYHNQATGNSNFITYSGGSSDWLGSDDGTRELPAILQNGAITRDKLPGSRTDVKKYPELAENSSAVGKAFSSTMDIKRQSAPMNQSLSLSVGNQLAITEKSNLGYTASFTYGRNFSFYKNGEVGIYKLNEGAAELNPQFTAIDAEGTEEANIGALGSFAYNINPEQQIGGNVFFSRVGTSTARFQQGHWPQELDNIRVVNNRVLSYVERDIISYQLRGKHFLKNAFNTTFDWNASLSSTKQDEPDRRLIFTVVDTTKSPYLYTITGSNFDNPSRYFRTLEDDGNSFNVNFSIPFTQWSNLNSKFKFGAAYQTMDRTFSERIFSYLPDNERFNELNGDLDALFSDDNFDYYIDSTKFGNPVRGNVVTENSKNRNNYTGEQTVQAAYGMFDLPFTRRLRFIGGLRFETTEITAVSQDTSLEIGKVDEKDFLPSVNLVYQLNPDMNLRFAGTQTLARPNFREIAPYSSKEFVNGYEFQGNPELKRTLIQNFDLRWEWFSGPGEILAVSGFYKKLNDPIERTFKSGTTESNRIITLANVDQARIIGAEFEARTRLDFISSAFSNFIFGGNLSLINSRVDIANEELTNRLSVDSTAESSRELQGQSPYILNLDLTYSNFALGTTATLHFNTFGERLSKVSRGLTPDIFEQPVQQLDLVVAQKIWTGLSAKLAVKNILDSAYKEVYQLKEDEAIYYKYNRGISYSFGVS